MSQIDIDRLHRPKIGARNEGKTFDLLVDAVQSADMGSNVAFIVANQQHATLCLHKSIAIARGLGINDLTRNGGSIHFLTISKSRQQIRGRKIDKALVDEHCADVNPYELHALIDELEARLV